MPWILAYRFLIGKLFIGHIFASWKILSALQHADLICITISMFILIILLLCYVSVTTCGLARDALSLLRERKDGYDIVISDVNMPDMDGFKLLEHVGLEMDLPVISEFFVIACST